MKQQTESMALKRVKKQIDEFYNRITKFEGILKKTEIAGHKFKEEYTFIEQLKTTLITIGLQVHKLERHSIAQHKRLRQIEDHLGISKKKRDERKAKAEAKMKEDQDELGSEVRS